MLVALVFAAIAGRAQCSPAFSYRQTPVPLDEQRVEFTNTTDYSGPGTATYTLSLAYSTSVSFTDSVNLDFPDPAGSEIATMYMVVYDSATSTLVCADSVSQPVTFVEPACESYFYLYLDHEVFLDHETQFFYNVGYDMLSPLDAYTFIWTSPDSIVATETSVVVTAPSEPYMEFNEPPVLSVTITGGGCSTTEDGYGLSLPAYEHEPFDCSYFKSSHVEPQNYLGSGVVTFLAENLGDWSGASVYHESFWINYGDGVTDTLEGDATENYINHTYAYTGNYNVTAGVVMINNLDSAHETCVIDHTGTSIQDSFAIQVIGSHLLPISTPPANVSVCQGQPLILSASDTFHSTVGYYHDFHFTNDTTYSWSPSSLYVEYNAYWLRPTADSTAIMTGDSTLTIPASSYLDTGNYTFVVYAFDGFVVQESDYPVHVSVTPTPAAGISGSSAICSGVAATYTDTTGSTGMWSIWPTTLATVDATTGVVTGVAPGVVTLDRMVSNMCGSDTASMTLTIGSAPVVAAITGSAYACAGNSTTLADATTGGAWSSADTTVATVNATGITAAIAGGIAAISYTVSNACGSTSATATFSSYALPGVSATAMHPIVCAGSNDTLYATGAITYMWSPTTGLSCGGCAEPTTTAGGTYTLTGTDSHGCVNSSTVTITAAALPTITATSGIATCGPQMDLSATGGVTYNWSPATDVACTSCGTTTTNATAATTYTVTGTDVNGCSDTATVTPAVNRIYGHITFTSTAPDTLDTKVWLIQYNPTDSSLMALDSTVTCMDGTAPYFEFDGKPAGSYMVKSKLLYGETLGASGYVPTYSYSTPYWNMAAAASHTAGTDSLPIAMLYGTVPAGPGFIGGSIVSGAGKNTSTDIPVVGMIVYLRNAATGILTHVYTDTGGHYAFTGLADGMYDVYPAAYAYYTTPSDPVTLSASAETITNINFKQHTTLGTITPFSVTTGIMVLNTSGLHIYPNPTTGMVTIEWSNTQNGPASLTINDVTGKTVLKKSWTVTTAAGKETADMTEVPAGVYFIQIATSAGSYTQKIVVER